MILLQIYFEVAADQADAFATMYRERYAPALRQQAGYLGSKLLRLYPARVAAEIEAEPTPFNFQMELLFDTEENRRHWAASAIHGEVWALANRIAHKAAWRGYDVAAEDGDK
jgi:hypothetical protein